MDSFELELKVGFLDEAASNLAEVESSFLSLESNPNDSATIDKIFRLAHNLKGSSKAVGFDDMGEFTHEFESLLLKVKNLELSVSSELVSVLLACNDHLNVMIQALKADLNAKVDSTQVLSLIEGVQKKTRGSATESTPSMPAAGGAQDEKVEFAPVPSAESFEDIKSSQASLKIGAAADAQSSTTNEASVAEDESEVESQKEHEEAWEQAAAEAFSKIKSQQPVATASNGSPPGNNAPQASGSEESIRVAISRLEKLINYIGEMVILQAVLKEQVASSTSLLIKKTSNQMDKTVKEIQDISLGLRMVPIKPTFQKMQRIVRDTAKALNKEIQLVLVGEDTEIDKTILEKVGDPLVHLIRNSVDHGIEKTEDRIAAGKSPVGKVILSAINQSGRLLINVKDDGGGINPEKIKKKAIEKGIIKADVQLSDQDAINLIFAPGFSTKEVVTDISGRGVGMDVVKTNIHALSGEINIESKVGEGSVFKINLPLSLAIIESMVLLANGEKYVIPLSYIHETVRIEPKDFRETVGAGRLMLLRGENLPCYYLASLLGKKVQEDICQIAIVVRISEQPYVVLVDDIVGQYEIVRKKLGTELSYLKGVSGSTILGDGKPALILEPTELIKNYKLPLRRAA
jgi:two-component system chemotaxis sensor kinase CheA